jgi:thiol-disulfide isomerase/thioredoxin
MVTELTMENVLQTLQKQTDRILFVMFYGASCGPCKGTLPFYEEISEKYKSPKMKMKFYKFHVWENKEVTDFCNEQWKVQGVPMFRVFYSNKVIVAKTGGCDLNMLEDMVSAARYNATMYGFEG